MSNDRSGRYSYRRIRKAVALIAERAARAPANHYSDTVWDFHILPVVRFSGRLARALKADREIVELAALLHDHACLLDQKYYPEHHCHSARMARTILADLGYPEAKTEAVAEAILAHRGSRPRKRKTLEARILASADAMSHITELADMMYLAYGIHGLKTAAGATWLLAKFERSWSKIIPAGRRLIRADYRLARQVLLHAINKRQ